MTGLEATYRRILSRCTRVSGCLVYTGSLNRGGYGQACVTLAPGVHKRTATHRVVYEYVNGPIPAGLQIDHVRARGCTSRACCEPTHLEAVTPAENIRRGDSGIVNASKTHCPAGHPLITGNLVSSETHRKCRTCTNEQSASYRARRGPVAPSLALRAAALSRMPARCKHGHALSEANVVESQLRKGVVDCRLCARDRIKRFRAAPKSDAACLRECR